MFSAKLSSASATRLCCSASAALERSRLEDRALGDERAVAPDRRTVEAYLLAVRELLEERRAGRVDQPDSRAHELERPGIREPTRRRGETLTTARTPVSASSSAETRSMSAWSTIATSSGPEPLHEVLRAAPEPRTAGDLTVHRRSVRHGADELLAAEHPLELVAPLRVVEDRDARVGRVARHLLDP